MASDRNVRLEQGPSRGGGVVWLVVALIVIFLGLVAFNGGGKLLHLHDREGGRLAVTST